MRWSLRLALCLVLVGCNGAGGADDPGGGGIDAAGGDAGVDAGGTADGGADLASEVAAADAPGGDSDLPTPTDGGPGPDTLLEDLGGADAPPDLPPDGAADAPGDAGTDVSEDVDDPCLAAGGECMVPDDKDDGCPPLYGWLDVAGCGQDLICCVPDPPVCAGEGEGFTDFDTEGKCCDGLVPVPDCFLDETGGCLCPNCPCFVCTHCGDLHCGVGENVCNCPSDCEGEPPDCIPEGQTGPVIPGAPPCCPGAEATGLAQVDPLTGLCVPLDGAFLCTDCGDGACAPWENACICPADCTGDECFGLGDQYNAFETDMTCCDGLTAAPDCFGEAGACACPGCPCMVCLKCGDQVCGDFENPCNCPDDC